MAGARRRQIKGLLRGYMTEYRWSPGLALPSERRLAEEMGVNRITLRGALAELLEEGFLARKGRKLVLTGLRSDISEFAHHPGSRFITVMATWLADRFEYDLIRGIEAEAQRQGFRTALAVSKGLPDGALETIRAMTRQGTAGFAYMPLNTHDFDATNLRLVEEIKRTGAPVVVIDNHLAGSGVDTVTGDYYAGAYEATQHLIDLGHRNIAFVVSRSCYAVERRLLGFVKCLEDNGIHPDTCPVYRYDNVIHAQEVSDAVDSILVRIPKITAVCVVYDAAALKIGKHLAEKGVRVPEDMALVGYDNTYGGGEIRQFLTTTDQPLVEEGETACRLLAERINGYDGPPCFKVLPVRLVIGRSTGKEEASPTHDFVAE